MLSPFLSTSGYSSATAWLEVQSTKIPRPDKLFTNSWRSIWLSLKGPLSFSDTVDDDDDDGRAWRYCSTALLSACSLRWSWNLLFETMSTRSLDCK